MVKRQLGISMALGFLILSYATVLLPGDRIVSLTKEDSIIEWIGALLFLCASILFLLVFLRSKDLSKTILRKWPWCVLFLALFFFVSFGEEISWMQRIIGIETPFSLKEHNVQNELNLHNLKWFDGQDDDGSAKPALLAFLTAKRIFIYFCILFFVLLPLLSRFQIPFGNWFEKWRIPVLSGWIGSVFLLNLLVTKLLQTFVFGDAPDIRHALVEIMEANFGAIAFLEATWLYSFAVGFFRPTLKDRSIGKQREYC